MHNTIINQIKNGRYHDIKKDDMLNGSGLRVVLFEAGCVHNCAECHNPITHDVNGGILFDDSALVEIEEQLQKEYIEGITFSGGDPLLSLNIERLTKPLINYICEKYPTKTIWVYTGYSFEFLYANYKNEQWFNNIDVLVDGKFVKELKDNDLHWKGSSNQRVINMKQTIQNFNNGKNKIILKD